MKVLMTDLYRLKPGAIWKAFSTDNFAFWMSCAYLFFEYIRPQAIWPGFDIYPYWARTFVILAFVGWILDSRRQFVWTRFTFGVFAYLILVILSSNYAYSSEISWDSFMEYFNWVVVFFVLTQTVTTRHRFYIFLIFFMVASFKLSLYGARTFAMRGFAFADWGLAGPRGYFQNPGELAIQMLVFAPLALFFIQGVKSYLKPWQVYALYLMPVTAALTIIGTNTRGGQLALAVQIVALTMTTIIVGIIGFQLLPEEQIYRFESSGKDLTSIQRLLYWENGWKMMKDYPFLGVGFFNFPAYYTDNYSEDIVLEMLKVRGAELPHNIFIQVGTDTGFTGLLVFIWLIIVSFFAMKKLKKASELDGDKFVANMTKGIVIAMIGYIVSGQFFSVVYYPFFWVLLVFVSSLLTFMESEVNICEKMG
jgi:O-antigen ligase